MTSSSSKFYKSNKSSLKKKRDYDKTYRKKEKGSLASGAKKDRLKKEDSKRWSERRRRGIAGKGGGDLSHTKKGTMVRESKTKNRARNGKNGKSTLK